MKKNMFNLATLGAISFILSACGTLFDKDNTPPPTALTMFTPTLQTNQVWSKRMGSGAGKEYLKLTPAVDGDTIFAVSQNGVVTAANKLTGKILWSKQVNAALTSGIAASHQTLFMGSHEGKVFALRQSDGEEIWQTDVSSEILASVVAAQNKVIVKSIDEQIVALSATTGQVLWRYQQTVPIMILRGSSAPQVSSETVIAGFENGTLVKLGLNNGLIRWQETIAVPEGSFAIQRMVDIDANPIILGNRVYAVTYQGRVAALDFTTGKLLWAQDISSYAGMAADNKALYVADAKSHLWAFNAASGTVVWQQNLLEARNITGPALMGNYVAVGDAEGYLHWLNKSNGHFAARTYLNQSGILATPLVDQGMLYVYTNDGLLAAYRTDGSIH